MNDEDLVVERLTLDVRLKDFDFMTRLAAYRNTLARLLQNREPRKGKIRKQWSRKSIAQSFLAAQADLMRDQLKKMIDACGDIPAYDPDDKASVAAMERYVKRVLDWDAKSGSDDSR